MTPEEKKRERLDRLDSSRPLFEKLSLIAGTISDPVVAKHFDEMERFHEREILEAAATNPDRARTVALELNALRKIRLMIENAPHTLTSINRTIAEHSKETSNG